MTSSRTSRLFPTLLPLVVLAAAAGLAPSPSLASIATGNFAPGAPWFSGPLGLGVDKPALPSDKVRVDTDGDGSPDTDFDLPPELVPAADLDFEYRLSPSQGHLYVTRFNPQPSMSTSVCGGFPNVEVHVYALDSPPTLIPFALVGGGGSRCVDGPISKQPAFYDQAGSVRTMVLVGAPDGAGPGGSQVLWADLIGRQLTIDSSTYLNGFDQPVLAFSPSGNAAFITHGSLTIQDKYTFVDLCDDPLGGTTTTQDLPPGGAPSARVVASGPDFVAELLLGGTPEPGSQVLLSTACCPSGNIACCQPGVGCTDGLTADDCVAGGGAALDGTCSTVTCDEGCCLEGSCSVTPPASCLSAGGTPQGTFSCVGVFCPQPTQACCAPQGYCVDASPADCTTLYNGNPLGPGTNCFFPTPVICPALQLSVIKSGPVQVTEGVPFDYTIDYENVGDLLAPATVLRDYLSAEFVAASHGGQESGGLVEWSLGDLDVGQSGQVTLTVRAACGSPGDSNSAWAESIGLQFYSNQADVQVVRDTSPVGIQVTAIGANGLPVEGGDLVTLTFALTNPSASSREGVRFNIDLKAGWQLESVLDAAGGQIGMASSQSWEWVGDLGPLAAVDVVVTARVNACVQEKELGLKTVVVRSYCNREVGRAPHQELPVRRSIEVELLATDLYPPARLEDRTIAQVFQLLRHGETLDLRITATNPHPAPIANATISALVPFGYDPVGDPPFIAPTEPGAVWDPVAKRATWTGTIAAGGSATISFQVVHLGGDSSAPLTGYGVNGTCTVFSNQSLTPVPFPPAAPYLLGMKQGQLVTFRPGVDAQPQPLFFFPSDFLNNERMARAANGDIWVAGPPFFRFNPETLLLEGLPLEFVDDLGFYPWDVAVEPNTGRAIFSGNRLEADNSVIGLGIREYDPATATLFGRYDSPEENLLYYNLNIHDLMVADPWGGVGFTSESRVVYRHSGGDPDQLTPLNRPSVQGIALDGDGSYLLIGVGFGPTQIEDLDPGSGDNDVVIDLDAAFGPFFAPVSITSGDVGDIWLSSVADGLVVVHRSPSLTVDTILPEGAGVSPLLDILWVSDSCVDADGDGAGTGPGCAPSNVDCDDQNADRFPGAPERNDGLDNQCLGDQGGGLVDELPPTAYFDGPGESADFHWEAQQDAIEYQVVRAPVPDFSSGCSSIVTTDLHWVDTGIPAVQEVWYYLARAFSPFAGSFGRRSDGLERVIVCP